MPKFKNHVHVTNPETGDTAIFAPGDECPKSLVDFVDPANFEGSKSSKEEGTKVNYSKMKHEELADLAADRGLDFEGTNAELIARLEANDATLS